MILGWHGPTRTMDLPWTISRSQVFVLRPRTSEHMSINDAKLLPHPRLPGAAFVMFKILKGVRSDGRLRNEVTHKTNRKGAQP
jgi:hypothetical protein